MASDPEPHLRLRLAMMTKLQHAVIMAQLDIRPGGFRSAPRPRRQASRHVNNQANQADQLVSFPV